MLGRWKVVQDIGQALSDECVLQIVERGSFARAADDLGVSPALLSREVKLLEDSLGCTLLTRTTRSMSLTESGRQYYEDARGILDAVSHVEHRIKERAGTVRGHLSINAAKFLRSNGNCPYTTKIS